MTTADGLRMGDVASMTRWRADPSSPSPNEVAGVAQRDQLTIVEEVVLAQCGDARGFSLQVTRSDAR
ncbi:MAG: hypothetical protein WBB00_28525 [Mycobacterium sp.]